MNDVEKVFHEDLNRNIFSEAVADDQFDFVDSFEQSDVDPDEDDNSAESEDF